MARKQADDPIYALHHSLEPIILEVTTKVLKLRCFQKSRQHFNWDFVNDIGVINLLRKQYFARGKIAVVFESYQSSRLDRYSHRYESLFALLVITIVGSVVSGVLLEHYKDFKPQITKWLKSRKEEASIFGVLPEGDDLFLEALSKKGRVPLLDKFCSSKAEEVLQDLDLLIKCNIARQMFDDRLIDVLEYQTLVRRFLLKSKDTDKSLLAKFEEHQAHYSTLENAIDRNKVFLAIDGYARGILRDRLESVGVEFHVPHNTDTADVFRGIPAAPGAAKGIAHVFGQPRPNTTDPLVLVVDSIMFTPEHVDLLWESVAVVTSDSGVTGHIPLICRGSLRPCVILRAEQLSQIRNGDRIAVGGQQGIVVLGLLVE
jgi:phosphohistidine swiveling domain-containing protein